MPNYTFTFKKDDVNLEFKTTDKSLIERQFGIWVCCASVHAQKQEILGIKPTPQPVCVAPAVSQPQAEIPPEPVVVPQPVVEPKPVESVASVVEPEAPVKVEEPIAEPQPKPIIEPIIETVLPEPIVEPAQNEVFDKASELLNTINSIQEDTQPQVVAVPDFEAVLENKIENPTFAPPENKDERFLKFIHAKNPQDKQNYLVFTAYYLYMFEDCERFSLKQINAKLMQNLSQIVEHEALMNAINDGLIEILPDLTGTAGASEYRLTEFGENSVLKRV